MSDQNDHLSIDGAHVATITVPPGGYLGRETPATTLHLFRGHQRWTVLRVPLLDSHNATATVSVGRYETLAQLLDELHLLYPLTSVVDELLNAGIEHHDPGPELHDLWRVAQIDRDFNRASVYNKDLSEGGLFTADSVPAIGRQIEGWAGDALAVMAIHLENLGYRIVESNPGDLSPGGLFGNPTLGTITVACYGCVITGTARVDAAGEIFIRADWNDRDDEDRGPGTDLALRARQLRTEPA